MLTRKEQLEYCTICTKRKFDSGKGIVCSLTGEHATFEVSCNDYNEDTYLVNKNKERKELQRLQDIEKSTFGLSAIGIKNLVVVGLLVMGLALAWFFIAYIKFGIIFFYPFILFAIGVGTMIKGILTKREKKKKAMHNVLDDSIHD